MITDLSIKNVVLIEKLDLVFGNGLGVLTGETGAGKSILLDALGLALGARAEARLVRHGASQATVSARVSLDTVSLSPKERSPHKETGKEKTPVRAFLHEHQIDCEDDALILRRSLTPDGRSRAFINDQPVSISLLRRLGAMLVEIQGQFDQQGLMDAGTHIDLLDHYAAEGLESENCADAYETWHAAKEKLTAARKAAADGKADEEFLRYAVDELEKLSPEESEEATLLEERSVLQNAGRITDAVTTALSALEGEEAAVTQGIGTAARALAGAAPHAGGALDEALTALDRATIELEEALSELNKVATQVDAGGGRLEIVEERLFALRDIARKHAVETQALPTLLLDLKERLSLIDLGDDHIDALEEAASAARRDFTQAADALTTARMQAAMGLDAAVNAELPALKLERAIFSTHIQELPEAEWSARGKDSIRFLASTNPGAPAGPIDKIASGGELSRFLLALKVALAETGGAPSIIFDEVDSGVGGATAAAVGARLARLAKTKQILVVTHSPQVAALGTQHLRVEKALNGEVMTTDVKQLNQEDRLEEVARMLSGAEITEEARAAAKSLLMAE